MKKRISALVTAVFFLMANLIFSIFDVPVKAEESANKGRIWGRDRYETAVKISREGWSEGAQTVIIVRGDDFPDGVCAAPLAKKYSAPILLTYNKYLPPSVDEELKRLKPKKVFILGEKGAVSKEIEDGLKSNGLNVKRLGGRDRYETSLLVAKEMDKTDAISVVTGKCFADSLSISSIAANKGMPILLVNGNEISKEATKYIKESKINKSYILGSSKIVSSKIEEQLPGAKRLWGKNRYETNLKILKEFQDQIQFKKVYIALSQGSKDGIDALSISALAAKEGQTVILVGKNYIDEQLKSFVSSKLDKDSEIVALGSEKIVSKSIVESIKEYNNTKDNEPNKDDKKDKDDKEKSNKVTLIISKDNKVVLNKNLDIDENKSAYDYLKENATVEAKDGFITSINGLRQRTFKELSDEEKKKGIMGVDWFIYLNGSKTSVGADGVYAKKGDTLKFDYHSWDWREFAAMDEKMPLVVKCPLSVDAGNTFKVEVTCFGYPVYNAKVTFNNVDYYTNINGEAGLSSNFPGQYKILVEKEGTTREKSITVNLNTQPGPGKEDKSDKILAQYNQGQLEFKIIEDADEYINIYVKSTEIKQDMVMVVIYDEKENLAYIDQDKLKNGELKFRTKLDKGKYRAYFRLESMSDKVDIGDFTR